MATWKRTGHAAKLAAAKAELESLREQVPSLARQAKVAADHAEIVTSDAGKYHEALHLFVQLARLRVSESCPLILPHHVALDHAREKARGKAAIGTTGRGIGPAYEDKVARRGLRVGDMMDTQSFGEKLRGVMDYHNYALKNYFKYDTVDFQKTLDECLGLVERLRPMVADIPELLHQYGREGKRVMFEGAQGVLL